MKKVNSAIKIFILLSLLTIIIGFIVSSSSFLFKGRDTDKNVLGVSVQEQLEFKTRSVEEKLDYNFKIPVTEIYQQERDQQMNTGKKSESTKTNSTEKKDKTATNYVVSLSPNNLIIPKLNVNTKVIEGIDGEAAIHEGAWLYPSSFEGSGEKILLGHRRFWGADDPRSFWNLDHLVQGDRIYYSDSEGNKYTYEVKAVSVRTAGDNTILKASEENIIKVISCSTADGSAGSSEKRIVVIATQV